ncbi:DUF3768 domain-containing protein [Phenylobacterium sp.]|uniref:DUF3768 domain-containing protein n=1 Tax=Phenylobacterium sp. TaxID=1871053 RepID=UPI0012001305|nr:DUF3768 domain-containing protein [Phenylobacterium sp.]THD61617.1 MAG: DUF3768 domain-containing protein [Phenylobacterium sp.]
MTPSISTRHRIRDLNDQFRSSFSSARGQWLLTCGVQSMGSDFIALAVREVRNFDDFSSANDPHGEHDFGVISVIGERLFWKIDYYDPSLTRASPDPADPARTKRVLTLMLAAEY